MLRYLVKIGWGARGRRFKSCRPDHFLKVNVMADVEFETKKKILSDAFAASVQSVACRYGTQFGQDYVLQAKGRTYYAHAQRDGGYSIREDGKRPVLEVAEAELVNNQSEQQKIRVIADLCAELVLLPIPYRTVLSL